MFDKILEEHGFAFNGDRWANPEYPWIMCTNAKSDGAMAVRGFMNKPRIVNGPVILRETLQTYKQCPILKRKYVFAENTLASICAELNEHYPNAVFAQELTSTGTLLLTMQYPNSALTCNLATYNAFMAFVHKMRSQDFSTPYADLIEEYLKGAASAHEPIVKSTDSTINIFVDYRGLKNTDLWKIRNVSAVTTHKIVATFPNCPALLAPEFADLLSHTYIEFVCQRKG